MNKKDILLSMKQYGQNMRIQELKDTTIYKYIRDIRRFRDYLEESQEVDKLCMIEYKRHLLTRYKPASVNSYLISVNRYFTWCRRPELHVRLERMQRKYSLNHVLEMEDYRRLLDYTSMTKRDKYYCIMRTLAGTGIRVGELRFITYEAVEAGLAAVNYKGKLREICIPEHLKHLLRTYCEDRSIRTGCVFCGRIPQKPMDVSGIWKGLKRIAVNAEVDAEKVYPHSFRHFFAKTYMNKIGNLTELSDILGHSSIETTRIYTMETVREKRDSLGRLAL